MFVYMLYSHFNYIVSVENRKSIDHNDKRVILLELLDLILESAIETETQPFLIYGTLLGCFRNNNLICYDYDLDFGIDSREFDKLSDNITKKLAKSKRYSISIKSLFNYKHMAIIHKETGLNADILPFNENKTNNTISRAVPQLYSKYYYGEKVVDIPINWIYPLQQSFLENRRVLMPNKSKLLLESYYGETFMTPDHKCNIDCSKCTKI